MLERDREMCEGAGGWWKDAGGWYKGAGMSSEDVCGCQRMAKNI